MFYLSLLEIIVVVDLFFVGFFFVFLFVCFFWGVGVIFVVVLCDESLVSYGYLTYMWCLF